jgi:type IV pilus assembly protein PilQ
MKINYKKIILIFIILCFCFLASDSGFAEEKLISLDFHDINVRELLKILADFSGKNIILSDKINDKITIKLDNVSWTSALDVILQIESLSKQEEDNLIIITQGNGNYTQKPPLYSTSIKINFAKAEDVANLLSKQKGLLAADGSITADARTNSILIQNSSDKITAINNFIKIIDVPVKQALIEGRIVTVDDQFTRDLGIKLGTIKINSNGDANSTNMDLPATLSDPGHFSFTLATLKNDTALDMELSALESQGHAKIVSNPKLLTGNHQTANIESGEEIPYQEKTSSGATDIAFKKAVLGLKVTPEILSNNKIILHLQLNQDKVSSTNVAGVPAIQTEEIQTQITVNNGETIVLGGIYEEIEETEKTKTPFLSDVPLLGALFTSTHKEKTRKELMIFVTSKIVD